MALGNGQSSNSTESEKYNNNLSLKKLRLLLSYTYVVNSIGTYL